jgi:hypothetical protein
MMSSAAISILGPDVLEIVRKVDRLLLCASGAIHTRNEVSLHIFLKTAYDLLEQCAVTSVLCLVKARVITRGLSRFIRELFAIIRAEDVTRRMNVSLLSHLANFSLITEPLFDEFYSRETMKAIEYMIENVMLTVKYIDLCLPVDIMRDDHINCIEDVSEYNISQMYEYRFMCGML